MYVTRILNINLDLIQVMGAVTGEEKGTEPMLVMELMDHGCEFWVGHDFQVSKISSWFQLLKQMKWLARAHQYIVVDIHQLKSTSDFAKRFTFVIFAIGIPQTLQIQGFCRSIFFYIRKDSESNFRTDWSYHHPGLQVTLWSFAQRNNSFGGGCLASNFAWYHPGEKLFTLTKEHTLFGVQLQVLKT